MTRAALFLLPLSLWACSGKDGGDTGADPGGSDGGEDGAEPDCDLATDADCDGTLDGDDCEPSNPLAYPGAAEIPYDGVDNDCAGDGDLTDVDGDGHDSDRVGGDDCNDGNGTVYPGADEICYDGLDQDCDGVPTSLDDETNDCDGDGHEGRGTEATDCNDTDPAVNPDAVEVWYDGVDDNCDGNDSDQDLDDHDAVEAGGDDCDDDDPLVYGGTEGVERLNGKDADCDGTVDNPSQPDAQLSYYGSVASGDFLFGMSVLPADDADGDGIDDFFVGGPLSGSSEVCGEDVNACEGRVLLFPGAGPAASGAPTNSAMGAVAGFAGSSTAGSWLGWDMSRLSDLDGDGVDDFAFGAPLHQNAGAVMIFSGADIYDSSVAAPLYPNNALTRLTGNTYVGLQVDTVGDTDGDGLDELAGGTAARLNQPLLGEIAIGTWAAVWNGATLAAGGDIGSASAQLIVSESAIGGEVVGGKDIDQDGIPDMMVGSRTYSGESGVVAFVSGVDINIGGNTAVADYPLVTGDSGAEIGVHIAVVNDLDGDGYDEVAVSAHGAMGNGVLDASGEVYLIDGDVFVAGGTASTMAFATIRGESDFDGLVVGGERGMDVDADGLDDLMVVRLGYPGQSVRGASYIMLGSTLQGGGVHNAQDSEIFLLSRADGDWWGMAAVGWDMEGDGDADVLLGGPNGSSNSGMAALYRSYFSD